MTIMNLTAAAATPRVLQFNPQLPHIAGVLGGASRTTRTTKGVVSHANDWKEEVARGSQSGREGRSAQDQEAQGQEEGRPQESQEVGLTSGRRPQPRPQSSHPMAQANAAARRKSTERTLQAAAAKPSHKTDKPKNKKEKIRKPLPAKTAVKAVAKTKAVTKTKPSKTPSKPQPKPIELYYWPTPNGWKITIMLEECGLAYEIKPVNIGKGEQFAPEFLAIAPNNRIRKSNCLFGSDNCTCGHAKYHGEQHREPLRHLTR